MFNSTILMKEALIEAKKASLIGEIPVGAVMVDNITGEIIARSHNKCQKYSNPLYHAEFLVINETIEKIQQKYLNDFSIFVTLEPCSFCCAAIELSRVGKVFYSAPEPKTGSIESNPNFFSKKNSFHQPEIFSGIMYEESVNIILEFFRKLR